MEIFKGKQHFRRIELRLAKRELLALDVQHEITTAHVLHDKVYTCFGLETRVKAEQEGMTLSSSS